MTGTGILVIIEKYQPRMLRYSFYLGDMSDMKIIAGDEVVGYKESDLRRHILAIQSEYFRNYFEEVPMDDWDYHIQVPEFSPAAFKIIVDFLYIGKVVIMNCKVASEVLRAADKYGLQDLKDVCSRFIEKCED